MRTPQLHHAFTSYMAQSWERFSAGFADGRRARGESPDPASLALFRLRHQAMDILLLHAAGQIIPRMLRSLWLSLEQADPVKAEINEAYAYPAVLKRALCNVRRNFSEWRAQQPFWVRCLGLIDNRLYRLFPDSPIDDLLKVEQAERCIEFLLKALPPCDTDGLLGEAANWYDWDDIVMYQRLRNAPPFTHN